MYFPADYAYPTNNSTNLTALPQQLNSPNMFDCNNPNLKKLALRTSIAIMLLLILSCLAAATFSSTPGELTSQDRSITVLDMLLILFTLTLCHFIVDFISPDHEDPILSQVARMGTWVI